MVYGTSIGGGLVLHQVKQAPFTAVFHRDMMAGESELFLDVVGIVPPSSWEYCKSLYSQGVRAYHTFAHTWMVR